jgi:hypothetical protein
MSWHALVTPVGAMILPRRHLGGAPDIAGLDDTRFRVVLELGSNRQRYQDRLAVNWCIVDDARDEHRVSGRLRPGLGASLELPNPLGTADVLWHPNRHLLLQPGEWVTAVIAGPPDTCFEVRRVSPPTGDTG